MTINNFLTILGLTFCTALFTPNLEAQETESIPKNKYALKVYNAFGYNQTINNYGSNSSIVRNTQDQFEILRPSVALQWKTKTDRLLEVEVNRLSFNRTTFQTDVIDSQSSVKVGGGIATLFNFGARVEHFHPILKKWNKKWRPFLGFGMNIGVNSYKSVPEVSNSFENKQVVVTSDFSFVPRIIHNINSRLFLDFNLPINIINFDWQHTSAENPYLPASHRRYHTFSTDLLPKMIALRIGMGLRI